MPIYLYFHNLCIPNDSLYLTVYLCVSVYPHCCIWRVLHTFTYSCMPKCIFCSQINLCILQASSRRDSHSTLYFCSQINLCILQASLVEEIVTHSCISVHRSTVHPTNLSSRRDSHSPLYFCS